MYKHDCKRLENQSESKVRFLVSVLTFCAVPALKARCTFTAVIIHLVRARGTVLTWIRIAVVHIFRKKSKKKRDLAKFQYYAIWKHDGYGGNVDKTKILITEDK